MEADLFPDSTHSFLKISKGSILYVRGKKPGTCPKWCRGKVVRVIHHKSGGETSGAKHLMLLR